MTIEQRFAGQGTGRPQFAEDSTASDPDQQYAMRALRNAGLAFPSASQLAQVAQAAAQDRAQPSMVSGVGPAVARALQMGGSTSSGIPHPEPSSAGNSGIPPSVQAALQPVGFAHGGVVGMPAPMFRPAALPQIATPGLASPHGLTAARHRSHFADGGSALPPEVAAALAMRPHFDGGGDVGGDGGFEAFGGFGWDGQPTAGAQTAGTEGDGGQTLQQPSGSAQTWGIGGDTPDQAPAALQGYGMAGPSTSGLQTEGYSNTDAMPASWGMPAAESFDPSAMHQDLPSAGHDAIGLLQNGTDTSALGDFWAGKANAMPSAGWSNARAGIDPASHGATVDPSAASDDTAQAAPAQRMSAGTALYNPMADDKVRASLHLATGGVARSSLPPGVLAALQNGPRRPFDGRGHFEDGGNAGGGGSGGGEGGSKGDGGSGRGGSGGGGEGGSDGGNGGNGGEGASGSAGGVGGFGGSNGSDGYGGGRSDASTGGADRGGAGSDNGAGAGGADASGTAGGVGGFGGGRDGQDGYGGGSDRGGGDGSMAGAAGTMSAGGFSSQQAGLGSGPATTSGMGGMQGGGSEDGGGAVAGPGSLGPGPSTAGAFSARASEQGFGAADGFARSASGDASSNGDDDGGLGMPTGWTGRQDAQPEAPMGQIPGASDVVSPAFGNFADPTYAAKPDNYSFSDLPSGVMGALEPNQHDFDPPMQNVAAMQFAGLPDHQITGAEPAMPAGYFGAPGQVFGGVEASHPDEALGRSKLDGVALDGGFMAQNGFGLFGAVRGLSGYANEGDYATPDHDYAPDPRNYDMTPDRLSVMPGYSTSESEARPGQFRGALDQSAEGKGMMGTAPGEGRFDRYSFARGGHVGSRLPAPVLAALAASPHRLHFEDGGGAGGGEGGSNGGNGGSNGDGGSGRGGSGGGGEGNGGEGSSGGKGGSGGAGEGGSSNSNASGGSSEGGGRGGDSSNSNAGSGGSSEGGSGAGGGVGGFGGGNGGHDGYGGGSSSGTGASASAGRGGRPSARRRSV